MQTMARYHGDDAENVDTDLKAMKGHSVMDGSLNKLDATLVELDKTLHKLGEAMAGVMRPVYPRPTDQEGADDSAEGSAVSPTQRRLVT